MKIVAPSLISDLNAQKRKSVSGILEIQRISMRTEHDKSNAFGYNKCKAFICIMTQSHRRDFQIACYHDLKVEILNPKR